MIDLLKKNCDKDATLTLDPTLLLPASHYSQLCKNISKKEGIFTYILDNNDHKTTLINNASATLHQSIIKFNPSNVEDWLAGFRDCSCVITDSYHGCLFSIIFNKPFICILNQ